MMVTIRDLEVALEKELGVVLHKVLPRTADYSVNVEIFEGSRKKRRDASQDSWQLALGEIRIRLNPQHAALVSVQDKGDTPPSNFGPIKIRGEYLSETVLQDRR